MSKSAKRSDSLKKKHWSIKAHESLITRNAEGHFCLNVEGGAENGFLPYIGELRQDKIRYQSGRLHHGEIVLEVNGKKVAGMIKKDVIALIKRSADPVSLVTVKQNATITKDIRQYLCTRFTKNSVDSELQHQIRENLHMRVVPCTTRNPQEGERQGIDYNFISVEEFKLKEKAGQLLESGVYENNYYGTPKPPADPPSNTNFPAYSRSPASTGYSKEGLIPADSLSPPSAGGRAAAAPYVPKNLGPLPGNWEIAYTENNEKYFIDHSTGTTHWLDPRLAQYLKLNVLECSEQELPYGWEKVNDPVYGVYYIDHINRCTQYENPVTEAKRRYAGAQLPQRGLGPDNRAPPPLREPPPTVQSAAALEKQREAEAAAMWPDAGLRDYADNYPYPYPNSHPSEQDLEADLQGDVVRIMLPKTASGFGFTIIGGDRPGELLQIKSIVQGGVADRDGQLCVGDVLVRINGISVITYNHRKVVDLFQSIPLGSDVEIEVRRGGYPLPEFRGDELPSYMESNQGYGGADGGYNQQQGGGQPPELTKVTAHIVKGPLGFGFSLGESPLGPVVKQIMDVPRCAQLREGDVLAEVNGENVQTYVHTDLVTVLKRCPKGNQASFMVLRTPDDYPQYYNDGYQQELPPSYGGPAPDGIAPPPAGFGEDEPFTSLEVRLNRQVSGFGFRIIGGREEGSQATIGAIVAGGAADLDGRLQIGDEITHINGRWTQDASHRDVISLMGEAAASGEVVLGIRRKMPVPETMSSGPVPTFPTSQEEPQQGQQPEPPKGVREVTVVRPNVQTSFGFVLQSNTLRSGCMICRLIPDSPADRSALLYTYDELLAVNGHDVSRMDHGDIVALIKSSPTEIHLAVRQPEDLELFERQMQQLSEQQSPGHQPLPAGGSSNQQHSPERRRYPSSSRPAPPPPPGPAPSQPQQQQEDNRRQYHNYPSATSAGGMGGDEELPQISADLSDIASDDEEIYHINIKRDGGGFGFSIRGGAEYSSALCVLRIADRGAAENQGQLKVGDELLEINGNSTEGMLHSDAITIIKHGGDIVKLIVRRLPEETFIGQRADGREILSPIVSPSAKERYNQAYMSALQHGSRGNSEDRQ